jgi:hypothetical protein
MGIISWKLKRSYELKEDYWSLMEFLKASEKRRYLKLDKCS